MRLRLVELTAEPLSVPLIDPFVIATGRVDATRSALVRARIETPAGLFDGLGEASCLPPVTREDQPDALREIARAARTLVGTGAAELTAFAERLDDALGAWPVARAGVEMALLDALARARGAPLYRQLSGIAAAPTIVT
ncbi:MAG: hypothetical protein ACK4N5_19285, partial [Myxococcales bacterium]